MRPIACGSDVRRFGAGRIARVARCARLRHWPSQPKEAAMYIGGGALLLIIIIILLIWIL